MSWGLIVIFYNSWKKGENDNEPLVHRCVLLVNGKKNEDKFGSSSSCVATNEKNKQQDNDNKVHCHLLIVCCNALSNKPKE
jgi:hypothetical protein